jgi:hypothetical protein
MENFSNGSSPAPFSVSTYASHSGIRERLDSSSIMEHNKERAWNTEPSEASGNDTDGKKKGKASLKLETLLIHANRVEAS